MGRMSINESRPYASLMRYKRWADAQLFSAVLDGRAEPQAALLREIIGHLHVVDRIFQAHLQGVPHAFTSTRLPDAVCLTDLCRDVAAVDDWLVDHAEHADAATLAAPLSIRFTDGTRRVFTRAEILLHLSHHGAYHRGNADVVLRMLGMAPLPDRYLDYVAQEAAQDASGREYAAEAH
jgi:uncharacterized damage-inducible protein DinB